jgi:two-component system, OmpR family, sensor kinase
VASARLVASARPVTGRLTGRAVLAGCLVALVSVLATAAVAVPLANRAARDQAAESLAAQADLLAAAVRTQPALLTGAERVAPQLARQSIDLWIVTGGEPDRSGLPPRVLTRLAAGQPVSLRGALVGGQLSLVEGRPLGGGNAIVLTRPFASGIGSVIVPRLWVPLLAGLGAGALIGMVLAGRLSGPIRRAAAAATRLRGGDRQVRVPVEPPVEVADLARALNDLAAALASSEARQRDFLLSISHELRTPLTVVKGYAEAVADGVLEGDEASRAGAAMLGGAEQLERLISDLLDLARLAADDFPLRPAPVDLTELVGEVATAWAPRATTAGLRWQYEPPPDGSGPVVVITDRDRIRQVVDGLLGNALRVVPAGAPVVLALAAGQGYAVIEVRDGGPGLTDDDLAVAFERGQLAARYREVRPVGSGLGLALAARLVWRLGGTIVARHAAEGGARFTVTLPRQPTGQVYPART